MTDPTPHPSAPPAAAAPQSVAPDAAGAPAPSGAPPVAAADAGAIRAAAAAEFAAALKAATGHDSIAALTREHEAAEAARLAEQGRYQELHQQAASRLAEVEAAYHAAQTRAAIVGAAGDAVDPDVVLALLAPTATVGADGAVTIGGKPAAEAVAALLAAKPYLARAAGSVGSGATAGGGSPSPAALSMRDLADLKRANPAAYAAEIKRRAAQG